MDSNDIGFTLLCCHITAYGIWGIGCSIMGFSSGPLVVLVFPEFDDV